MIWFTVLLVIRLIGQSIIALTRKEKLIFFLFMKSNNFFLWNPGDIVTGSDAQVSGPVQTLTGLPGTVTVATQSLFACSLTASSQTPFSFLPPTIHAVYQLDCSTTEWHCCLGQKSPLPSYLASARADWSLVLNVSLPEFVPVSFLAVWGTLDPVVLLTPHCNWQFMLRCFPVAKVLCDRIWQIGSEVKHLRCCVSAYYCMY